MAAEVLKQVGAALDCAVQVEAGYASGRTRHGAVGFGQHDCRLVEGLHQTGSDYAQYTLVPLRVIDYGGVLARQAASALNHLQGLLGNLAVYVLALVVVLVDLFAYLHCRAAVCRLEELDGEAPRFHTAGGVDARTDLEDDVINADVAGLEVGQGNHRQQALARVLVELAETEMGQYPVFPHDGHQVGGDADHQKVEQRNQAVERDVVLGGIGLHELEAHSAAG